MEPAVFVSEFDGKAFYRVIMQPKNFAITRTEAHVFNDLANSFLTELGFSLVNEPGRILGRYRESIAAYKSFRGLYFSVGFDPGDSSTAQMFCGRQWLVPQQFSPLSNCYSNLAKRLGIDIPLYYELPYGEQMHAAIEMLLTDMRRTLPVVVARVTLADLLYIEREPSGAESQARARFGPMYAEVVEISEFLEH